MSTAGVAMPNKTPANPGEDQARRILDQALDQARTYVGNNVAVTPCEHNPDAWWPDKGQPSKARDPIRACLDACPVLLECRAWAHAGGHHRNAQVLGGEWWNEHGQIANPWPKRKGKAA